MNSHQESNNQHEEFVKFDALMACYLSGKATEQQTLQLHQMAENGFSQRFQWWVEQHYLNTDATAPLPSMVGEEMLSNILERPSKKPTPIFRWWNWAAAAILALGLSTWYLISNNNTRQINYSETVGPDSRLMVFKGKQYIHLPDGTSVLMNDSTELSYYSDQFEKGNRSVALRGEAYFDVKHDPAHLFEVKTGHVTTHVLGTAFNVRTNKKEVIVTVTRGLVQVSGENGTYAKINPDQQITVNAATDQYETKQINAKVALQWKNNSLILDNVTLREAKKQIEAHYGVKLSFTEAALLDCRVTASFLNQEDMETVVQIISEMIGGTYSVNGKTAVIQGGSCV